METAAEFRFLSARKKKKKEKTLNGFNLWITVLLNKSSFVQLGESFLITVSVISGEKNPDSFSFTGFEASSFLSVKLKH